MLKDNEIIKLEQDIAEPFCEIKSHQNRVFNVAEIFRLLGFFTNHFKRSRCEDSVCNEIRKKFMGSELEFIANEKMVNLFMISKFNYHIEKKSLSKEKRNFLILKYIDFLRVFVANPKKLLFVFEKSKSKIVSNSFFLNLYVKRLDSLIKRKFFNDDEKMVFEKDREEMLKIRDFFKISS